MTTNKFFAAQKELDERIVKEKGLEGQDLIPEKILALQVEVGELANEQRTWKFWSEDREPRYVKECAYCNGTGFDNYQGVPQPDVPCFECDGYPENVRSKPLLEEYVDCFHFILSIGNDLEFAAEINPYEGLKKINVTDQFNALFSKIGDFSLYKTLGNYREIVGLFLSLGEMLGFTYSEIEAAYFEKNEINHARQDSNY